MNKIKSFLNKNLKLVLFFLAVCVTLFIFTINFKTPPALFKEPIVMVKPSDKNSIDNKKPGQNEDVGSTGQAITGELTTNSDTLLGDSANKEKPTNLNPSTSTVSDGLKNSSQENNSTTKPNDKPSQVPDGKPSTKPNSKTTYGSIEFIDTKIPHKTEDIEYPTKEVGTGGWITQGSDGISRKEVRKVYIDGKLSHTETVKDTYVFKAPVNGQWWYGTKVPSHPWDEWANASDAQISAEVVKLINAERKRHGLPQLKTGLVLPPEYGGQDMQELANIRAKEISIDYSHNSASGSRMGAEAIYKNRKMTPKETVDGWLASPGHRAILLSEGSGYMAVGFYKVNEMNHYVLSVRGDL